MSGLKAGFIGAGHMAGAMIKGMVDHGGLAPESIGVYDLFPAQTEKYAAEGHLVFAGIPALVRECPVVFLCVKPQTVDQTLPLIREGITLETILVSVAAGITAERIKSKLGECKLILAMPNTPIELGKGAVALGCVPPAGNPDIEAVEALLQGCAITERIPHELMPEIIPINGSSPAFLYEMAQTAAKQAASAGIDESAALRLFGQTLIGSAMMLIRSGDPSALIAQVATPGGTTAAALKAMESLGFGESLRAGMQVCVERARELNRQL